MGVEHAHLGAGREVVGQRIQGFLRAYVLQYQALVGY